MTAARPLTKRFLLSFAGAAEYEIGGRRYEARYFANTHPHMAYNEGVLEHDIIPAVGTVRYESSQHWHEFPPREVVALFPGFVGARWRRDYSALEYDGPAPVLVPSKDVPHYLTAVGIKDD